MRSLRQQSTSVFLHSSYQLTPGYASYKQDAQKGLGQLCSVYPHACEGSAAAKVSLQSSSR